MTHPNRTTRRVVAIKNQNGFMAICLQGEKTMKNQKKYYRAIFQVEILSETPVPDCSIEDVAYEVSDGHWSGSASIVERTKHTGAEMAKLLEKQGSDSGFFQLTPDGERIEE
jgi:hypothetical protein